MAHQDSAIGVECGIPVHTPTAAFGMTLVFLTSVYSICDAPNSHIEYRKRMNYEVTYNFDNILHNGDFYSKLPNSIRCDNFSIKNCFIGLTSHCNRRSRHSRN
ncbi:MAG: hypothetical protein EDM79_15185 [Chloroflexi bacterium]|nr:MAG: hypothetical protein EDM79_15185 [Chloroflexota bacterium]